MLKMIDISKTYLLQFEVMRIKAGTDVTGLLIFIGIVVLAILVTYIVSKIVQGFGGIQSPGSKQRYNRFLLSRAGYDIGLEKQHIQYLERLIKTLKVKYPSLIFTNPTLLDAVLKRGIESVERQLSLPERERLNQLNLIWEIKQRVEVSSKRNIGLKSTYLIRPGQSLVITAYNGERFHSKVIANHTNAITVTYPVASVEKEHLFRKGSKLKVFFWRDNDSGYSFITKVSDADRMQNIPGLHILHSRKIKREQHRKYSRKPLKKSCFLYPAELVVDNSRGKQEKKLIVHDNMRHMGIISDISAGGCSIASTRPHKKGSYLKIEFDIRPGTQIPAFGKVQGVIRQSGGGNNIIMHVQFLKLSSAGRNQIYSYIYNYL
jgi:c-di-GMP-binding flagellar brake protein YcgR